MAQLSESEFKATFTDSMRRLTPESEPSCDFLPYFESIPITDFAGYECPGDVTYVWETNTGQFQHVLFDSDNKNVFMVLVLDVPSGKVAGHRLLNLNEQYGISES